MLDVGYIESLIAPALPFRRGRGDGRLIEARTKNSIMKRSFSLIVAAMVAMLVNAVAPNGSETYYQNANGKNGAALKTALRGIIYNRTEKSYDYLWTAFRTTDSRNGMVWDMYSDMTNYVFGGSAQGANYSKEGDSYNREHSFPKSWFGGEVMPMYTDLHHMYPTDGFVNNKRGNYPFGETNGNSYKSHNDFSKLGSCTYPGYTGTVFEPADEYKGDFARTYFYMVTCYEEKLADWYSKNSESRATIDGSKYPGFQTWQLNMLLEWAADDPVSDKETDRNNAVAGIQGNRNPFIDYPGLEQYIWGSKKDDTFSYNNYVLPTEYAGYNSGSGSGGQGGEMTADSYVKVTSTASLTSGQYLIVYEEGSVVFNGSLTTLDAAGNTQSVSISNNTIAATTTINGYAFTYDATSKTLKSASGYYIGQTSDANGLASSTTSTTYTNTITIDGNGNADIVSNSAHLRYNNGNDQNRFRYYKSSSYTGQKAIQLYKFVEGVKADPIFNGLADVSVDWGSALTLTKGTYSTSNFVTDGAVTLTSLNEGVVTVSGLTITPVAVGTTLISVSTSATTNYNAGSMMFPITVNAPEGKETAKPSESGLLFGETFGNNTGSAREWSDSYSVKSGVLSVYSGITGYTIANAKQSKNNTGSTLSGLMQSTQGTEASIIIGPLNVADYNNLGLTYQWKAGSINSTYYTKAYYATSSNGTYSELTGTGNGATTFVERAYSLPAAAQVSTLYLKIVWNTSNTNGFIDEVRLTGSSPSTHSVTLNRQGYATYCSEYPLDFSDNETADYSAWQVTGVNGTAITFAQITGSIKGGQGILLKGEAGATIELTSVDSENVLNGNLLEGTLVPWFVETDQYYGLSGKKFVKVKPGTVSDGKALLPASIFDGNDIKAYTFEFEDDATAIKTIDNGQRTTDGVIYNLAGQRLGRMQKGINIVNGKKILF